MTPTPTPGPDRLRAPTRAARYEYWAALADPRLRFRNCGVFGERTDEIAERLEPCAAGAEVLVVQGGINDIAQSLAGPVEGRFAAVDEAAANLRRWSVAASDSASRWRSPTCCPGTTAIPTRRRSSTS